MASLRRRGGEASPGTSSRGEPDEDELEWDKDKLLDTLHWLKQILGVVFGLIFGLVPVTGLVGAVIFGGVNVLVTYTFYHSYLEIDEDDYGGHSALLGEGFMPSFFLFQLSWILTYSMYHF